MQLMQLYLQVLHSRSLSDTERSTVVPACMRSLFLVQFACISQNREVKDPGGLKCSAFHFPT